MKVHLLYKPKNRLRGNIVMNGEVSMNYNKESLTCKILCLSDKTDDLIVQDTAFWKKRKRDDSDIDDFPTSSQSKKKNDIPPTTRSTPDTMDESDIDDFPTPSTPDTMDDRDVDDFPMRSTPDTMDSDDVDLDTDMSSTLPQKENIPQTTQPLLDTIEIDFENATSLLTDVLGLNSDNGFLTSTPIKNPVNAHCQCKKEITRLTCIVETIAANQTVIINNQNKLLSFETNKHQNASLPNSSQPTTSTPISSTSLCHLKEPNEQTINDGIVMIGGLVPVGQAEYQRMILPNATTMARKLLDVMFSPAEMTKSNLYGSKRIENGVLVERPPLSPTRSRALFMQVEKEYPGSTSEQYVALKEAVNGKCRRHREVLLKKQKLEQQQQYQHNQQQQNQHNRQQQQQQYQQNQQHHQQQQYQENQQQNQQQYQQNLEHQPHQKQQQQQLQQQQHLQQQRQIQQQQQQEKPEQQQQEQQQS